MYKRKAYNKTVFEFYEKWFIQKKLFMYFKWW